MSLTQKDSKFIFTMTRERLQKLIPTTATAIELVFYLNNQSQSHVTLFLVQGQQQQPVECHILQNSYLPACNNEITK
jgi:hypothetical protein